MTRRHFTNLCREQCIRTDVRRRRTSNNNDYIVKLVIEQCIYYYFHKNEIKTADVFNTVLYEHVNIIFRFLFSRRFYRPVHKILVQVFRVYGRTVYQPPSDVSLVFPLFAFAVFAFYRRYWRCRFVSSSRFSQQ